jgi:cysteinyl-tRNA synthetase
LFDVNSYEHYGTLSGRTIKDMIAGARVEVAPYKRDPMDFVLWKPSSDDLPGWDSPWGRGRPGWHIECSAMSRALFGEKFDIHGGGLDLAFPHHENEKAQSCSICGEDCFAQVWMHNEMLQVEGKKMSKSLGNFFSVRDLLDQGYPGEVIRFVYLSTHYRKPMDWTEKKAHDALKTLAKWRSMTIGVEPVQVSPKVLKAVADDLNTHGAIAELHTLAGSGQVRELRASAEFLGLLTQEHGEWIQNWNFGGEFFDIGEEFFQQRELVSQFSSLIEELLQDRTEARAKKNFLRADAIRDAFAAAGVRVKDTPTGVEWELGPNFDPSKLEALK